MSKTGRIHSFETFGTVDGPGIRFVVFMQGCPLRCVYCHNRDTWNAAGGREFSVDEVMEELLKYMQFIKYSKGGITVSGGEPTLQAEFVGELFKKCRALGIHTALDTSGFADVDRVKELLLYTDLILLDIKQGSPEKHKQITGVANDKIKKFAEYSAKSGIPIWIRYVLIPGFTDDEEDLKLAAQFIQQLSTVEKIEVLPYHSMGKSKWEKLGEKYPLENVKEPSAQQVEKAKKILEGK